MRKWLRRIRAALLMGVTWAVVWLPAGLLLGLVLDPDGSMDEPWILVGTYPGFLAGVVFSIVLGIAARRRKLDDLSVAKVAGWGAVAGVIIGSLPFVLGDQGPDAERVWLLPVVVISSITLLSAVSAAGSLVLARKSERQELPDARPDAAAVGVAESEAQELPGGRR
jgi:membrane protease YdiL (CAAX protease family)